jgi:hypothetical protein
LQAWRARLYTKILIPLDKKIRAISWSKLVSPIFSDKAVVTDLVRCPRFDFTFLLAHRVCNVKIAIFILPRG